MICFFLYVCFLSALRMSASLHFLSLTLSLSLSFSLSLLVSSEKQERSRAEHTDDGEIIPHIKPQARTNTISNISPLRGCALHLPVASVISVDQQWPLAKMCEASPILTLNER